MADVLQDKTILVVGRGGGIARALAFRARLEGARTDRGTGRHRDRGAVRDDQYFMTGVTLEIDGGEPLT